MRKIKPLKQPTKRPPILLDNILRKDDPLTKINEKDKNKLALSNPQTNPH